MHLEKALDMLIRFMMEDVEKITSHDVAMAFGMQCRTIRKRMIKKYTPGTHVFDVAISMESLSSLGQTFGQDLRSGQPDTDLTHLQDISTWLFILAKGHTPGTTVCISNLLAMVTMFYIAYIGHYAGHAELWSIVEVFEEILAEPATLGLNGSTGRTPPNTETIH